LKKPQKLTKGVIMPKSILLPGAALKLKLAEYQLNPTRLAKEIRLSQSAVRQIVIGKTKITVPVALRLAKYFGTTADYWLDIQKAYDISEAANDSKLKAILQAIDKIKGPIPVPVKKSAPAKKTAAVKKPAPAKKPVPVKKNGKAG
jgi:addiction module HigA family antidote